VAVASVVRVETDIMLPALAIVLSSTDRPDVGRTCGVGCCTDQTPLVDQWSNATWRPTHSNTSSPDFCATILTAHDRVSESV
jgi:hypothetical protein